MKFSPGMRFDLQRMRRWLSALGDPQDRYPAVHVAGTNGKGSVAVTLASIYRASGFRVGLYTSPHLENVNERFRINHHCISDQDFSRLSKKIKPLLKGATEFEFFTVLAFVWFAEENADLVVLEVGLGGRLDATNVVRHVLASVITNIDLEHTEWLGRTISKIAYEKAGIIKPHVPVLTMASGEALAVISNIARARHAPLTVVMPPVQRLPTLLVGEHQQKNAALAVETIRRTAEFIPKWRSSEIGTGLRTVHWPGRFEVWKGQKTIFWDGAHNPASIRILVETLRQQKIRKVFLLFGVLKDKNYRKMVEILAPLVKGGFVVPVTSDRSADPQKIVKISYWKKTMKAERNWSSAWKKLMTSPDKTPILVTGSLYLIGEIKRTLA